MKALQVKQYNLFRLSLGMMAGLLLASCAFRDEGAIDYRKAEIPETHWNVFQTKNNDIQEYNTQECKNYQGESIRPVLLKRKNVAQKNPKARFSDHENMVIRLVSAYIEDYTEGLLSWINDTLEGQIWHRGEIAVVVNIFPAGEKIDFSSNAPDKGRVVFFSNDVVTEQFLNFDNMPIYGPSSKGKDGLVFGIWIIELDISGKLLGTLLKTIASHGSTPLPASSKGNQILNSIGSTLLDTTSKNDVNFRYYKLMEPDAGGVLPSPIFEAGFRVFIRANLPRSHDINWTKLVLDENTGRLYECANTKKCENIEEMLKCDSGKNLPLKEYKRFNYLVIRIDKDISGRDLYVEDKAFNTLKQLTETEEKISEENARKLIEAFERYSSSRKLSKLILKVGDFQNNNQLSPEERVRERTRIELGSFAGFWSSVRPSIECHLTSDCSSPSDGSILIPLPELENIFVELELALNSMDQGCDDACQGFTRWYNDVSDRTPRTDAEARDRAIEIRNGIRDALLPQNNEVI